MRLQVIYINAISINAEARGVLSAARPLRAGRLIRR